MACRFVNGVLGNRYFPDVRLLSRLFVKVDAGKFVREEFRVLLSLSDRKRPLVFLLVAAVAMSSPLFVGVLLDNLRMGVIGCMGGFSVLYMRRTTLIHRTRNMLVSAFTLTLSFGVGILCSYDPTLSALSLAINTLLVTIVVRRINVLPPGSFFFILVACIARAMPYDSSLLWERMAAFLCGSAMSVTIGFIYSVFRPNRSGEDYKTQSEKTRWSVALWTSLIISLVIGGGFYLVLSLEVRSPYWVPISSIAILQGIGLRHIWQRMFHRLVGTFVGLGLAGVILSLPLDPWGTAIVVFVLGFFIEALVTRNYALAVVFITPLTLIFAEINSHSESVGHLMLVRFVDTLVGSIFGFLGGVALCRVDVWMRCNAGRRSN